MSENPWPCEDAGHCLADQLRARLAEVEAERDDTESARCEKWRLRAEAAEARLAAVRALCERNFNMEDHYEIDANDVAAILEGRAVDELAWSSAFEDVADHIAAGDRAEAEPVYPFGTPCRFAGTGCGEEYCTCAETVGHFCPIECVTCGAAGDDLGFSGLCPTCRGIGRHLDGCTA